MKIGIIGYGRMGKTVESVAKLRGHEIVSIIDIDRNEKIGSNADCYIDFSVPEALEKNLPILCDIKIPAVIGVTGWNKRLDEYAKIFAVKGNKGIWSGNYSLGVNLYWKVIRQAAETFDKFAKEYDVMVHEFHHKNKIDSPSGTAIQTAKIILEKSSVKDTIITETLQRKRKDNELHVTSTRGGLIPGTHNVIFDSSFDTVEITHTARTREGFALGSVIAAEKINTLAPGLYNFSEIFDSII
jgi:4-hydroxy-tetrahydrodipicolinate reductase